MSAEKYGVDPIPESDGNVLTLRRRIGADFTTPPSRPVRDGIIVTKLRSLRLSSTASRKVIARTPSGKFYVNGSARMRPECLSFCRSE